MPPRHCPVSGTARSVGRVTLGMGTDCQGAYRGHRAVEKYISANSKPELPSKLDRSKSADLYFLAFDGQPVPGSRPLPGIRAARGSCAVHWAGRWLGIRQRWPGRQATSSSATRNRDRLGSLCFPAAHLVDELKETPTTSNRKIAKLLGVDHKTVTSVRDRLASGGEIPHVTTISGEDGKTYGLPSRSVSSKFNATNEAEKALQHHAASLGIVARGASAGTGEGT